MGSLTRNSKEDQPAELSVLDAMLAALMCDEMKVAEPMLVADVVDDAATCDANASASLNLDLSLVGASAGAACRPPERYEKVV